MAYVLTYPNLVNAIETYVQRVDTNFVNQVPLFIMLGQRRVARELKILGNKVFIQGNLTLQSSLVAKPMDWLNSADFYIGTGTNFKTNIPLEQVSYGYCQIYWPNTDVWDVPKFIADYTFNSWYVAPTPDQAYPYTFSYYQIPTLIDGNDQVNWLTENAPDILLYACLLETASYLHDDERVPTWKEYYALAKDALTKEDLKRIYDAFSKREG